jgi:hypothetical protein
MHQATRLDISEIDYALNKLVAVLCTPLSDIGHLLVEETGS